jgi:hypothetical protein
MGLSEEDFWNLTPREWQRLNQAQQWRNDQQARRDVTQAWQVAALVRARYLPSLAVLLSPPRSRALTEAERAKRQQEFDELAARSRRGHA